MKEKLTALWAIFRTDEPPEGDPPAGDPPAGDPPADDTPPGPGEPGGDNGDQGTALVLETIPENLRGLFEGIDTEEALRERLAGRQALENYEMPSEGLPEGAEMAPELFSDFIEKVAKPLNLNQEEVNQLVLYDAARAEAHTQAIYDRVLDLQAKANETELSEMESTMGADKFKPFHQNSLATLHVVAGEELMAELQKQGLDKSPAIVKLGAAIHAKLMKEDSPSPTPGKVMDAVASGDKDVATGFYGRMDKLGKSSTDGSEIKK